MSKVIKDDQKLNLHPRNKNRGRYDLNALIGVNPELKKHLQLNKFGVESINFSNPKAVKALNKSILNYYYGIKKWDFSNENLCPPIPGRAEYIHHIADLLNENNEKKNLKNEKIICLDIGVGASCIYPIIGATEYSWNFIGVDIDPKSIKSSESIVKANPNLKGKIECRVQQNPSNIFRGILTEKDKIDAVICNPPFHSSIEEAIKSSRRKVKNLTGKNKKTPTLNFSGNFNELVYEGGELQFISTLISESVAFSKQCLWFSFLVSKESNLKRIYALLDKNNATEIKMFEVKTGNKISRIIAWTYLNSTEKRSWQNN